MAAHVFYHEVTGAIMRFAFDDSDLAQFTGVIPNTQELAFDESTNVLLVDRLRATLSPFQVVAGVLQENGTPVVINPDGEAETDRKAIPNRKAQIETYMGLNDLPVPPDLSDIAAGSNAAAIVAYINGTLLPRINQLDTLVQRTNANTNAGQGIFQILRYIGKKLGFID